MFDEGEIHLVILNEKPVAMSLGEEATFSIAIKNYGKREIRNITLREEVPPGLEFHKKSTGFALRWNINALEPQETRQFKFKMKAVAIGSLLINTRLFVHDKEVEKKRHIVEIAQ